MKKTTILLFSMILTLALSGCSVKVNSKETQNQENLTNAGVYKSINKGDTWAQKVLIPTISGRPGTIGGKSTRLIATDPSDHNALYYATMGTGMYFTYDGANSWYYVAGLGDITPLDIAVDPKNKCTIYVSIKNRVMKTVDCSRSWEQIFFDTKPQVNINAIAVDHFNSQNIYIGTSRGELVKSSNGGESWETINRFETGVDRIFMDPNDSRKMIATITTKKGIRRSSDGGYTWDDLRENLKNFKSSNDFKDLSFVKSAPGKLYMATLYGLLKSDDYGDNWSELELIPPDRGAAINAIAVDQNNQDEIYYVTNTTLYRSSDGGQTWKTIKLPSTGFGVDIVVDDTDPNIVYLGIRRNQQ